MTNDLSIDLTPFAEMGPIDFLVIEFKPEQMTGEAFPLLVDLVDRGIIRILDLAFVEKLQDGTVITIDLGDLQSRGFDVTVFEGASSGLLGDDDIEEAAGVLEAGTVAGILVFENSWAGPFASALRRAGAELVASGRIPVQALLSALDATESVG